MEDSKFPQLREITQPEKLAQMLRRHLEPLLAADGLEVQRCALEQLRYKPGGDCRILLTAQIGRRDGEAAPQFFFGRLFRSQEGRKIFASCDRAKLAPPRFGPAMLYLPEWEMILWAYPNDPNLPGLPAMVDAGKILALAQAAPEKFGLNHPPASVSAAMTKYVPGMRCGYIYSMRLNGTDRSLADDEISADSSFKRPVSSSFREALPGCAVYGKAYRGNEGEKAFALMQQIWQSPAAQRGEFILPQPYSYDPERQILWQEAIPGQPFASLAENLPNLPEAANEIGRRLAAFHNTRLQLPLEMTLEFQMEDVRRAVAAISNTFPGHGRGCAAVAEKLWAAAARLGPGPVTPVHASFKFSHIFATPRGMAFIDFDGANLGDPGYDLGRFLAHLYKMQAGAKIDAELAAQTATNFCASYNRAAAAPVPQERINWFATAHLIGSQVYKSVKRLDEGQVNQLLNIADQLVTAK